MSAVPRFLLEGRPGIGKTTVARRLVSHLRRDGVPVAGFTTEELRERGRRVGFAIETVDGRRSMLAHVDITGPPRVGRYGVDLAAFERLTLPTLDIEPGTVAVVDELGKMELASRGFRDAFAALIERPVPIVATVHTYAHPFTDALKDRRGVELIRVTAGNRDDLPTRLAATLEAR
jgi:nucleoside-triphosphatase